MATSTDVDVTIAESTTSKGESKPPSRARMIVVLGALVALGPLTIDMYLPALPKIADDLSVSSSVAQLTLTGTLAGLALGQLIVGPLSDSLGRRRPLMAGIVLHMLASMLCLFAPNIEVLGVARLLQGMGAAAGMVVAIAVVGDLFAESVAATVLSRLMLVLGVAPVVAPSLGAAVLLKASWHWVFAVLVVLAGLLLLMAALALPETLPASHRRPLKVRSIAATYVELLRDVRFVGRRARCGPVRSWRRGSAPRWRSRQRRGRVSLGDDGRHGDRTAGVTGGRRAGHRNRGRRHRRRRRRTSLTFVTG
jgi:MFS transporter, DHA1 family, multidrug resistance protein